jgi:hypothetical protein
MRRRPAATYVARMTRLLPSSTAAAAVLAAALFLSASGGAVAGSMITGKQIKDGSITAKDVKDKSLAAADFAPDARSALAGPAGPQGVAGASGVTAYEVVTKSSLYYTTSDEIAFTIGCPTGKVPLGGTAVLEGANPTTSYTTAEAFPNSSWHFTGAGPAGPNRRLTAWLYCAKMG